MLEHMVWAIISNFFWLCKYAGPVFGVCVCPYFTCVCICVYIYMSARISKCGTCKLIWRALGKAVSHTSMLSVFKCFPISMDLSPKHREPLWVCRYLQECLSCRCQSCSNANNPPSMDPVHSVNGVRILKSKIHILYPVYSDYRHCKHISQCF